MGDYYAQNNNYPPQQQNYYPQQNTYQGGNVQQGQYQAFDQQQPAQDPYAQQAPPQRRQSWYEQPAQLDYSKIGDLEFQSRQGFVRKVYTLLSLELASTLILTAMLMNIESFGNILVKAVPLYQEGFTMYYQLRMTGFFWFILFACIFLQIAIFCCSHLARKVPVNYILLVLYIFCYGMMIGGICQTVNLYYLIDDQNNSGQNLVWAAWIITFALVISLTAYACTTQSDMTLKGGFIFCLFLPLICCLFLSIFFPSRAIYIVICSIVIIMYGFYLIWETQMIMGGKRIQLSVDDYIVGSLLLYGTIVQLFLRILEILALSRR